MKDTKNQKKTVSPMAAAITGAVIGAGAAVAGAAALKNEKTRAQAKKALTQVKNKAVDYMESLQKDAEGKKEEAENNLKKGTAKVKKIAQSGVKSGHAHMQK